MQTLSLRGFLEGHCQWVTAISIPSDLSSKNIVSSSRDKTIIVWELNSTDTNYGMAWRVLKGHSHFVQDVVISSNGQFCLSGSWDSTLRLWEINSGHMYRPFLGHTKDVLSVAFSPDNNKFISG